MCGPPWMPGEQSPCETNRQTSAGQGESGRRGRSARNAGEVVLVFPGVENAGHIRSGGPQGGVQK